MAHSVAIDDDFLVIACNTAVRYFEAHEFALNAFSFLIGQRLATGEVAFIQLAYPAEVRFEQRGGLIDVVAIERHAGFESESVARGESTRQHAGWCIRLSGFENLVPELLRAIRGRVNFVTVFAGVTSARDDSVDAVHTSVLEVVILDFTERHVSQLLKN